jgi:predicted AAA+ superfamily ATPase
MTMSLKKVQMAKLRQVITENLRIQRAGAKPVPYIDVANALSDIAARQNHAVFARRGCGKTLLLHDSAGKLPNETQTVYLNCEDFKHHSFPTRQS